MIVQRLTYDVFTQFLQQFSPRRFTRPNEFQMGITVRHEENIVSQFLDECCYLIGYQLISRWLRVVAKASSPQEFFDIYMRTLGTGLTLH